MGRSCTIFVAGYRQTSMSREAKEENQDTTQIEINDSEEKDGNNPSTPEQDSQALGQADEEPEEEEEELPPPTPEELKELRQQAAKAEEFYDRLQRQVAEADNLRKRLAILISRWLHRHPRMGRPRRRRRP